MLWVLDNCCFCIDLRLGALAIGYISMFWNAIQTSLLIVAITKPSLLMADALYDDSLKEAEIIVASIHLVFVVINLIFSIVLVIGAHKHNRECVKSYLIYTSIFVMINILAVASDIVVGIVNTQMYLGPRRHVNIWGVFIDFINTALSAYYLLAVRSYFTKVDDYIPRDRPVMYTCPVDIPNLY